MLFSTRVTYLTCGAGALINICSMLVCGVGGNQIIATFKELSTFGGRQTHRLLLCLFTLLQATQVGNSEEEATSPRFFSIPADSSSLGSMFFIN